MAADTASNNYFISSASQIPTSGTCPSSSFVVALGGAAVEKGHSLRQTSDGGFVVAGETSSSGAGGADLLLARYASDNNLLWAKTWGGAGTDYGGAVITTNDGGYAVVGRTDSAGITTGNYDIFLKALRLYFLKPF